MSVSTNCRISAIRRMRRPKQMVNGRPSDTFGEEIREGEPHIVWIMVSTHEIL
jgi:hypothetical protein